MLGTWTVRQPVGIAARTDLAALMVELYEDGRLCVPSASEGIGADPVIACTVRLRG